MPADLAMADLLDYTDWERGKWRKCLRRHSEPALEIGVGPHGHGRFQTVGDLVRHIFSAEKRYVERLSGLPLTDTVRIPATDIEVLFEFGRESRQSLTSFIKKLPDAEWDTPREFELSGVLISATARKVVTHVLMHEIRHWAQIATILRFNGLTDDFHDFLFSPAMGGEFRR
jgi:uncharacterized damage-inducible protein DinB